SAIFNSPMGGLLFTLEVILLDFSLRTITPVIIASVIANVTTQAILRDVLHHPEGTAIFSIMHIEFLVSGTQMMNFVLLGILCGLVAVALTRLMFTAEHVFAHMPMRPALRPAFGGALLGIGAVLAAVVHAPLAAILILLDLTGDYKLALPAMLETVIATGVARRIFPDSIYTMSLRQRGVRMGGAADRMVLHRMHVEQ